MLNGLKGLLESKKAFAGGLLIICATVLVGLGKMTVEAWQEFSTYIFIAYASAETVNGVAATVSGTKREKKLAEKPAEKPAEEKKE
jgi:hypothetical protein